MGIYPHKNNFLYAKMKNAGPVGQDLQGLTNQQREINIYPLLKKALQVHVNLWPPEPAF